jgi:malonate transporter and related proteins
MSELRLFELVLPVLAPVLVGWLAVRFKLLAASDAKALTSAFLYIFLPALIVAHLASQNLAALFDVRFILATVTLMLGIYGLILLLHRCVLRRPLGDSVLAAFACAKFNAVVVGLPLLLIAIGKQAIVAVIINLVIGYFTILPLTLFLLEIAKGEESGPAVGLTTILGRALRHTILDPLILATLAGLAIAALKVTLPGWLDETLLTLGGAAIPVPLVAVGMAMSGVSFHDNIGEVLWVSMVRVVASPILAILVAVAFGLSPIYSIALVISFSLPTAKMAFAIAESHGMYARAMAAIVTITTLSLVVIYPVFLWICERIWPGVVGKVA